MFFAVPSSSCEAGGLGKETVASHVHVGIYCMSVAEQGEKDDAARLLLLIAVPSYPPLCSYLCPHVTCLPSIIHATTEAWSV